MAFLGPKRELHGKLPPQNLDRSRVEAQICLPEAKPTKAQTGRNVLVDLMNCWRLSVDYLEWETWSCNIGEGGTYSWLLPPGTPSNSQRKIDKDPLMALAGGRGIETTGKCA